uniref:C-type lectin domain-containing protein n=1 Tax=Poecilia latipinna TaxID=48699 RepID=A0A3B3UR04_9TELE
MQIPLNCSCRTEDASCCLQTTQISTEIYSSWFIEGFVFEDLTYLTCLKCEAGWEQHGGNCYYFSTSKSSWTDSRRSCTDLGSDLVKIDSREEQMFLLERLRVLMKDDEDMFWIGLTDLKEEGKWFWVDGSPQDKRQFVKKSSSFSHCCYFCMKKFTSPGQKHPIKSRRRVLALSINHVYVLLNLLIVQKFQENRLSAVIGGYAEP